MTPTEFLTTLWGDPPSGMALIWTLPNKHSTWFLNFSNVDRFVTSNQDRDIYTGVSLAPPGSRLSERMRVSNNTAAGIAGLWADIDVAGPKHQKPNLPPTLDDAMTCIDALEYRPSITVHSGHGLQCWWLFVRPWMFRDAHERSLAQQLTRAWHNIVAAEFGKRGWTVDATHDLARVMRLPGSVNHKAQPLPVEVLTVTDFRWRDIPKLPQTTPTAPPETRTDDFRGQVGELHLSPDLEPSAMTLELMLEDLPQFARSWRGERSDFLDQSPSAYDMSIASFGVQAGMTDQEIAALMVAHRRRKGVDLKLRDDYYRRTISKARESHG